MLTSALGTLVKDIKKYNFYIENNNFSTFQTLTVQTLR
jgi:hypothetical protein